MIINGIHDSIDTPLDIPIITGAAKRKKEQSRSMDQDALTAIATSATTAAVSALADAVSSRSGSKSTESPPRSCKAADRDKPIGLSPGRMIELRMKNYEQLRYVQSLFEDNIISETEFVEQKALILKNIREFGQ